MAVQVNAKFEEAKKKFFPIFRELKKTGILPFEIKSASGDKVFSEDLIYKDLSSISKGLFTIAVCGEVKAGKSTLLNALIFKDKVLPTFEAPETAKLTFIRQSKKERDYFVVNYYSKEEWKEIKSSLSPENKEALKNRIEYSMNLGVFEQNCIGKEPIEINNIKDLCKYTSVPREDDDEDDESRDNNVGVYTPFVKNVEIYLNSEMLENLQIVDTPGLNDPNKINSNETTKWIGKAHAIIYVTQLRGFSKPDLEFFEKFMVGRTTQTRVIVQNKIDNDKKNYRNAFAKNGNDEKFRSLGLFGPSEIVCAYSSKVMLALERKKNGKNDKSDDMILDRNSGFEPDPDKLAEKVSMRLFNNSGAARIEATANVFDSVYSNKIELNKQEIQKLEFEKRKYAEPIQKLNLQLQNLQKSKKNINNLIENKRQELNGKIKTARKDLERSITNFKEIISFSEDIERLYNKDWVDKMARVKADFPRIWDATMSQKMDMFQDKIDNYVNDIQADVKDIKVDLIQKINAAIGEEIDDMFIDYTKENWNINIKVKEYLTLAETRWFDHFITFDNTIISNFIDSVNKSLSKLWDKLDKHADIFEATLKKCVETTLNELATKLDYLEDKLGEIIDSKDDNQNNINIVDDKISKIHKENQLLENKMKEINSLCKSIVNL